MQWKISRLKTPKSPLRMLKIFRKINLLIFVHSLRRKVFISIPGIFVSFALEQKWPNLNPANSYQVSIIPHWTASGGVAARLQKNCLRPIIRNSPGKIVFTHPKSGALKFRRIVVRKTKPRLVSRSSRRIKTWCAHRDPKARDSAASLPEKPVAHWK